MNPFDLRGPEFLLFYLLFAAIVISILAWTRLTAEASASPRMDLADPYTIAYLRGGKNEVLRVTIISLVDRGLLVASGESLKRAASARADLVSQPLERAILGRFASSGEAAAVFKEASLEAATEQYKRSLQTLGLLPDPSVTSARLMRFLVATFFLAGISGTKMIVALSRGRTNILFLVILTIIVVVVAQRVAFPRLTTLGVEVLKDIQ